MPQCKKIRRKHRQICIGDLDTLISIKTRVSNPKNFLPDVAFTELSAPWALWETLNGVEVFDETNTAEEATDMAIIRYDARVTKEFFVELNGKNFRILKAEDFERRQEWTKLLLTDRGPIDRAVNDA